MHLLPFVRLFVECRTHIHVIHAPYRLPLVVERWLPHVVVPGFLVQLADTHQPEYQTK